MPSKLFFALPALLALSACAQPSQDIAASYVSPLKFQAHSCNDLRFEAARISQQASTLSGVQNRKAQNDAVATGVALVLFWPAAFFIKGDSGNAAELARLKGEMRALETASQQRGCALQIVKTG